MNICTYSHFQTVNCNLGTHILPCLYRDLNLPVIKKKIRLLIDAYLLENKK